MRVFSPFPASTIALAGSTSSTRVQFQLAGKGKPGSVRVHNAGSATAFVEFGGNAVVASLAAGMPIPPGSVETFNPQGGSYLAAITTSGTTQLYVTPGEGI